MQPPNQPKVVKTIKRKFRKKYLWVPLAIMGFLWFIHGIEPVFTFEDIMDSLHVQDRRRYIKLAYLGVICCLCLWIYRIARSRK